MQNRLGETKVILGCYIDQVQVAGKRSAIAVLSSLNGERVKESITPPHPA